MSHWVEKFNFAHGLGISLLLHSCLALPVLLTSLHLPEQSRHEKLQIELDGIMSDRQVEEQHRGVTGSQPRPAVMSQAKASQAAQPEKSEPPTPIRPLAKEDVADAPSPMLKNVGMSRSVASLPAVLGVAGGEAEQRQQAIHLAGPPVDPAVSRMRAYLAAVSKRIQKNLVYPREVRKRGVEGTSTIAFTITPRGEIQGGSLRVKKSSGYGSLDASAIQSARVSAPFEKPPQEMTVAIAVSFNVDKM
jgi:periplasmic protein TonB